MTKEGRERCIVAATVRVATRRGSHLMLQSNQTERYSNKNGLVLSLHMLFVRLLCLRVKDGLHMTLRRIISWVCSCRRSLRVVTFVSLRFDHDLTYRYSHCGLNCTSNRHGASNICNRHGASNFCNGTGISRVQI